MNKALQRVMVMNIKIVGVLIILATGFSTNASAQQLYKWVDDQGVTHYGENLPNADVEHVALKFPEKYEYSNPEEDYYSIQNQLKRLQESRAKQREERQKAVDARAEKQLPVREVYVQDYEPSRRYYLPARYPHYYPKYKFGHHPKHPQHKKPCCNKPIVEKRRSGISQQAKTNRTKSVFTASR